jgi:hypothetical protein
MSAQPVFPTPEAIFEPSFRSVLAERMDRQGSAPAMGALGVHRPGSFAQALALRVPPTGAGEQDLAKTSRAAAGAARGAGAPKRPAQRSAAASPSSLHAQAVPPGKTLASHAPTSEPAGHAAPSAPLRKGKAMKATQLKLKASPLAPASPTHREASHEDTGAPNAAQGTRKARRSARTTQPQPLPSTIPPPFAQPEPARPPGNPPVNIAATELAAPARSVASPAPWLVTAGRTIASLLRTAVGLLRRLGPAPRAGRRLRVLETVSLGDKRFAAVIEAEGRRYLIGGGAGTVALLTALDPAPSEPAQP